MNNSLKANALLSARSENFIPKGQQLARTPVSSKSSSCSADSTNEESENEGDSDSVLQCLNEANSPVAKKTIPKRISEIPLPIAREYLEVQEKEQVATTSTAPFIDPDDRPIKPAASYSALCNTSTEIKSKPTPEKNQINNGIDVTSKKEQINNDSAVDVSSERNSTSDEDSGNGISFTKGSCSASYEDDECNDRRESIEVQKTSESTPLIGVQGNATNGEFEYSRPLKSPKDMTFIMPSKTYKPKVNVLPKSDDSKDKRRTFVIPNKELDCGTIDCRKQVSPCVLPTSFSADITDSLADISTDRPSLSAINFLPPNATFVYPNKEECSPASAESIQREKSIADVQTDPGVQKDFLVHKNSVDATPNNTQSTQLLCEHNANITPQDVSLNKAEDASNSSVVFDNSVSLFPTKKANLAEASEKNVKSKDTMKDVLKTLHDKKAGKKITNLRVNETSPIKNICEEVEPISSNDDQCEDNMNKNEPVVSNVEFVCEEKESNAEEVHYRRGKMAKNGPTEAKQVKLEESEKGANLPKTKKRVTKKATKVDSSKSCGVRKTASKENPPKSIEVIEKNDEDDASHSDDVCDSGPGKRYESRNTRKNKAVSPQSNEPIMKKTKENSLQLKNNELGDDCNDEAAKKNRKQGTLFEDVEEKPSTNRGKMAKKSGSGGNTRKRAKQEEADVNRPVRNARRALNRKQEDTEVESKQINTRGQQMIETEQNKNEFDTKKPTKRHKKTLTNHSSPEIPHIEMKAARKEMVLDESRNSSDETTENTNERDSESIFVSKQPSGENKEKVHLSGASPDKNSTTELSDVISRKGRTRRNVRLVNYNEMSPAVGSKRATTSRRNKQEIGHSKNTGTAVGVAEEHVQMVDSIPQKVVRSLRKAVNVEKSDPIAMENGAVGSSNSSNNGSEPKKNSKRVRKGKDSVDEESPPKKTHFEANVEKRKGRRPLKHQEKDMAFEKPLNHMALEKSLEKPLKDMALEKPLKDMALEKPLEKPLKDMALEKPLEKDMAVEKPLARPARTRAGRGANREQHETLQEHAETETLTNGKKNGRGRGQTRGRGRRGKKEIN